MKQNDYQCNVQSISGCLGICLLCVCYMFVVLIKKIQYHQRDQNVNRAFNFSPGTGHSTLHGTWRLVALTCKCDVNKNTSNLI